MEQVVLVNESTIDHYSSKNIEHEAKKNLFSSNENKIFAHRLPRLVMQDKCVDLVFEYSHE